MDNKTLAELTSLLDFGFLTETCTIPTPNGEYRFELKTITPLEEIDAEKAVNERLAASNTTGNEAAKNVQTAIELLARCILTVNGVALESHPNAKGDTPLQRKRFVVSKFSELLMLPLWQSYQKLKGKTDTNDSGEDSSVKK